MRMYYGIFHYKNGSKTDMQADTKRKKYMETHAHVSTQRYTQTDTYHNSKRQILEDRHRHTEASLRTCT